MTLDDAIIDFQAACAEAVRSGDFSAMPEARERLKRAARSDSGEQQPGMCDQLRALGESGGTIHLHPGQAVTLLTALYLCEPEQQPEVQRIEGPDLT